MLARHVSLQKQAGNSTHGLALCDIQAHDVGDFTSTCTPSLNSILARSQTDSTCTVSCCNYCNNSIIIIDLNNYIQVAYSVSRRLSINSRPMLAPQCVTCRQQDMYTTAPPPHLLHITDHTEHLQALLPLYTSAPAYYIQLYLSYVVCHHQCSSACHSTSLDMHHCQTVLYCWSVQHIRKSTLTDLLVIS